MRAGLRTRLERLEFAAKPNLQVHLQYGWVRKLPPEYEGERHLAITKRLSIREGLEWIEWEELSDPHNTAG